MISALKRYFIVSGNVTLAVRPSETVAVNVTSNDRLRKKLGTDGIDAESPKTPGDCCGMFSTAPIVCAETLTTSGLVRIRP